MGDREVLGGGREGGGGEGGSPAGDRRESGGSLAGDWRERPARPTGGGIRSLSGAGSLNGQKLTAP